MSDGIALGADEHDLPHRAARPISFVMKHRCFLHHLMAFLTIMSGGLVMQPAHADAVSPSGTSKYAAIARKMDENRARIFAPLGATAYSFDQSRLQSQPGGENRSIGSTLLQAPGVSPGVDGQVHVRGQ
ncbi:hypothetical protein [Rhodopila sp.]|uniref:hypothetical protein n=1 Tax=Rhodopila sp. TaxID=2480087 RepID=UPI003D0B0270